MEKTVGLNPKVPTQAIVSVIVFVAAHFGFDIEPELAIALATVLGFAAGVKAPPSPTITVSAGVEK